MFSPWFITLLGGAAADANRKSNKDIVRGRRDILRRKKDVLRRDMDIQSKHVC
jgi:hypothetical protein